MCDSTVVIQQFSRHILYSRGGSRIFEKGGPSQAYKHKKGVGVQEGGGGPTLGPMLKNLQCGPKRGGGGVRTPWTLSPPPLGSAHLWHGSVV